MHARQGKLKSYGNNRVCGGDVQRWNDRVLRAH